MSYPSRLSSVIYVYRQKGGVENPIEWVRPYQAQRPSLDELEDGEIKITNQT
jgi:hypothetical protein